jgi:membrane peptidoglycan carboxypeptidase
MLEESAFDLIHESWQRLGYPFEAFMPSYASAIGSSADRPAALAELMGIIVNDGVRYPSARMESLRFARGTPYETFLQREPARGEQVYPVELARVARNGVIDVVENGTARRAFQIFKRPDGTMVRVGGKTGTGDHRFETFGRGGRLIESRVVNRTATFVFLIGDRFFGTLTAYVHGPQAAGYGFTSSLPVQILKVLAPALKPLVARDYPTGSQ